MALNLELDEETQKHMDEAMREEREHRPEPERPAPTVTVEKDEREEKPEQKPEVKAEKPQEEKVERPRNPDGTFAKVEEKPAEKATEKPSEAPKQEKIPEGYVAHGALHEERERRKELKKQVEAMEARFQQLVAKIQEKPAEKAPDPTQDFPGHVAHHFNSFAQQQAELGRRVQNFEQTQEQAHREAQFMRSYHAAAADFSARQPDFVQAYNHLLKSRFEELTDAGYSKDQALHLRTMEEQGIVFKAFEDGVNPAERLYAVAKRRGYTAASEKPAEKPAVDPAEKLKNIEAGQKATPSMGGGAMKPKMTLQSIAQMSDEEFASLNWEKAMRELTP